MRRGDDSAGLDPGAPRGAHPAVFVGGLSIEASLRSDLALVHAVIGGDRDAFRALVEQESRAVVAACKRVLGDSAEAEDVAQEAFVSAYRGLATYRGEGSLGAWVRRIAVRLALRRVAQRREVTWLDPRVELAAGPAVVAMGGADPVARALEGERARAVRSAVAALPRPYREVVALRFFGELSLGEIAATTGRPLGTIKTQLHRGLSRLRERLGPGTER